MVPLEEADVHHSCSQENVKVKITDFAQRREEFFVFFFGGGGGSISDREPRPGPRMDNQITASLPRTEPKFSCISFTEEVPDIPCCIP